jgi:predicted Rossmann fold nucleotide-binding protein DprA/Smf involved in DNA uptake
MLITINFGVIGYSMKIAVVGSRSIDNYSILKSILDQYTFTQIISGGAKGIDTLAERYSEELGLMKPLVILPDWKRYNRGAGAVRNREIVDTADFVVAIWDGDSKGTKISINYAKKINKPIFIWLVNDDSQKPKLM